MRPRGWIEATLVGLAALALTIVFTHPVALQLDGIGRVNTDDGRWSIWVVSWVAHALTTRPLDVFHANIFYPHPYALAFSEANLVGGAIAAPVWALTHNPYAAHNIVFLLSFVLAFAGMYYLARHLTASRPAAVVSAVLFAFCPYIFARTAHVQLLFTGGLPLCLLAFHRLVASPSLGRAVALGALIAATALACAYYGIFAGLMVGLGTIVFAISRRLWRSREYWIALTLAAIVSVGLVLPFFLPYLYVRREMGFTRSLDDAREYAVNLGAWGASAAWAHRWWLPAIPEYNEVLFPGILATGLGLGGAAVLLARRGPWRPVGAATDAADRGSAEPPSPYTGGRDIAVFYLLVAILAFWAAFGPDAGLYRLFYETLPIFTFLRAPGRMGLMVTFALCVLAAFAAERLTARARRRWVAGTMLATLAAAELATMPLTQFRQPEPLSPVYRQLATLPYGAVVEFPYWYQRSDFPRHAFYMLNSTAHWKPLVNGYSDHIPEDFRRTVLPLSSFPSRESFGILGKAGARYVVFHTNMYDARLKARLVERLQTYSAYLRPLAQEGPVWLYEIVGWPN